MQLRLATLPIRHGGLGALAVSDIKNFAFLASFSQTLDLQQLIIGDQEIGLGKNYKESVSCYSKMVPSWERFDTEKGMKFVPRKIMKTLADSYFSEVAKSFPKEYGRDTRQRAIWDCLRSPHAQDFLYTMPISGLGQTMSSRDYRAVLSYKLMVPMFVEGSTCHGCNKVTMDANGDHAIHCKWDPGVKHGHDVVRDGFSDILRRAGIAARKEASVGLVGDKSDVMLRPADVLIYNWLGGKHTCVDLTCISPLVGINQGCFEVDKLLRNAVKKKYDKHDKACQDGGYEFIPFGFTSFGGLCEEAVELMDRVEKVAHQHLVCYKSTKFVFHRLGFIIQKGMAAQIVSRLPINFVL